MRSADEIVGAALADIEEPEDDDSVIEVLPDICDWAEESFYIIETSRPIVFEPHQKTILSLFTEQRPDGRFKWTTCMYSTIKKSGKTAVSALYSRWAAETWGKYQEIYNMGNKLGQAKGRAYKAAKRSIELASPGIKKEWDVKELTLTHLPSGSVIEALPIAGAGEAGGNQSLTVWTELWGFQYDDALLMWDELKPVLTRKLSQRFIDTYAGFKGVSELLWSLWDGVKHDEYRIHDELPIYANDAMGLIAYIDQGIEARRMPWQKGEIGREYYRKQEETETTSSYTRHHKNEWADAESEFISISLWDRLADDLHFEEPDKVDVVLAVDAAVSQDCTAVSATTYLADDDLVVELETYIWEPPEGGKIDYDMTLRPMLDVLTNRWRVIGIFYDEYQMHQFMTQLKKEKDYRRYKIEPFSQQMDRVLADTALHKRIKNGQFSHSDNPELRAHVQNAAAKYYDDDRLRIVKREDKPKNNQQQRVKKRKIHIDGLVALSMSAWRAFELLANRPTSARKMAAKGVYPKRR